MLNGGRRKPEITKQSQDPGERRNDTHQSFGPRSRANTMRDPIRRTKPAAWAQIRARPSRIVLAFKSSIVFPKNLRYQAAPILQGLHFRLWDSFPVLDHLKRCRVPDSPIPSSFVQGLQSRIIPRPIDTHARGMVTSQRASNHTSFGPLDETLIKVDG